MLPILLTAALICSPIDQDPHGVRVESQEAGVSAKALAEIQTRADQGLVALRKNFPGTPTAAIRVVVHKRRKTMPPQVSKRLHPGSPGLAFLGKSEIHILLSAMQFVPPNDLGTTLDHELVHVLLDQYVGKAGPWVPVWFHEGLAQHLTETSFLGLKEDAIVFRLRNRTHFRLRQIRTSFPEDPKDLRYTYAESLSFVAFLAGEVGVEKLLATARLCGPEKTFPAAFVAVTGDSLVIYEDQWADYVVHGSGALSRFLRDNCFLYLIILAVPILALAVARRLNRERRIGDYLAEQDRVSQEEEQEEEQEPE